MMESRVMVLNYPKKYKFKHVRPQIEHLIDHLKYQKHYFKRKVLQLKEINLTILFAQ